MKALYSILLTSIFLSSILGCKKQGCTDSNAANYNYLAKKDDGSCQYNSTIGPKKLDCYVNNYLNDTIHLTNDPNRPVDYLITCHIQVNTHLVIEPGVVIEFTPQGQIDFNRYFIAEGTAEEPIIMRGRQNYPGSWGGISLYALDSQRLDYVHIINGSRYKNNFNDSIFASIWVQSSNISIKNCQISGSKGFGIADGSYYSSHIRNINKLTVTNCNSPMLCEAPYLAQYSNLNFHDNTNNSIDLIAKNYTDSFIIPNFGTDYRVSHGYSNSNYNITTGYSSNVITIEAGITIRFANGFGMVSSGSINALGAPTNKIRLLGVSSSPGAWSGLEIIPNGSCLLDYVEIAYAGGGNINTGTASLYVRGTSGSLSVTNCIIRDGAAPCGIKLESGAISLNSTGTTFSNITTNICP